MIDEENGQTRKTKGGKRYQKKQKAEGFPSHEQADCFPGTGDEYEKKSKEDSCECGTYCDIMYVYCVWKYQQCSR